MQLANEICDRASALEFLLGRVNYERTSALPYRSAEFKLDRMRSLLALLGDPHLAFPAVHIAGTKGKGSTAAMIASVMSAAGYTAGLYTSPHLLRLEERFVVGDETCPEHDFVHLAARVQTSVIEWERQTASLGEAGNGPTFFEITTAMAMLHFALRRVDVAVLEVGLGGRLDSTNVCRPEVCVITSISFDHTRQLGNTLRAIAGEKAGIIKPGVPVISGVVADEPREAIVQTAAAQQAPLFERELHFGAHSLQQQSLAAGVTQRFDYWEKLPDVSRSLESLDLPLLGQHQAENGATAIAALLRLTERGWNIPEVAIRRGLAQTRCDARIQLVRRHPDVLVDVAHNVASIQALVDVIEQEFPSRQRILLFASSRDKDVPGMLRCLLPRFDRIVLTRFVSNPRGMEVAELHSLACEILRESPRQHPELTIQPDPAAAWRFANEFAGHDDLICITGSFFLATDLLPLVR